MPAPELWGRFQKAVYWAFVNNDRTGKPVVSLTAVELDVRWDDTKRTVKTPQGAMLTIDGTVVVNQVLPEGGKLWLGTLASLPASPTDVMTIVWENYVPDLKNRVTYREVGVQRSKNAIGSQG